MTRSRLRLKVLGLCAMALGLMAFTASAAQASGNWMLEGSNVTAGLQPSVVIGEIENKSASLLTEIAGAKVRYECTEADLIGAKLEVEGKLTNGGKVKFKGCETFLNGALSAGCVPKSAGLANGEIESLAGKGLMELHLGEPVTKIEPKEGLNFAVIRHNPATCALPELVPVRGKLVIGDAQNEGDVEKVSHLIVEHELSELFVISNTPEHAAVIDGSATAILSGEHAGDKWNGLPV